MIPGKKVSIGGQDWIVPPLSLKQLRNGIMDKFRQHDELIARRDTENDAMATWEATLIRGDIIIAALSRNYSVEELEGLDLDLSNIQEVWPTVLGLNFPAGAEAGGEAAGRDPMQSGPSITT